MNLDLTPEQAFFHGTTRQFLDDKVPTSLLRELRSDNSREAYERVFALCSELMLTITRLRSRHSRGR